MSSVVQDVIECGKVDAIDYVYNPELPDALNEIYKKTGYHHRLTVGPWSFLSQEEVKDFNNTTIGLGATTVYNFAMMYHGMGWVYIAAYDTELDKVFIRLDGGSNGYEVQMNMDKMKKYPELSEQGEYTNKYMSVEKFFKIVHDMHCKKHVDVNKYRIF